ncbi:hypothetical protein OIU76_006051 [Salix suchowensis]|nr:hypothetical protein OIU76_006051 [Salix suchowensis]
MGENESASSLNPVEKTWEEIVIEMPKVLDTTFRQEECIYKAPATIRNLNGAAYTPQVISIGPFHHRRKNLKHMQIQKQRYLKEFCKRLRWQPKEQRTVSEHDSVGCRVHHRALLED